MTTKTPRLMHVNRIKQELDRAGLSPLAVHRLTGHTESRQVDSDKPMNYLAAPVLPFQPEVMDFLSKHDIAVISTASQTGRITGAAIYYTLLDNIIYILTRNGTRKAHNIFNRPQIALTMYDPTDLQELQLEGIAHVETNSSVSEKILSVLLPPTHTSQTKKPSPLTKIQNGAFIVFRITPTSYNFSDYG